MAERQILLGSTTSGYVMDTQTDMETRKKEKLRQSKLHIEPMPEGKFAISVLKG